MEPMLIDITDVVADLLNDKCLPDPDLLNYYRLANERKITLEGGVDESIIGLCKMIMLWNMEDAGKPAEERKPIWIYIMNYGGDVECMWAFIDAISTSVTPVYTVNLGVCYSAAAYIFMVGSKRLMMPNAHLMIHEGSAAIAGDANKVRNQIDLHEDFLSRFRELVLSKTKIPKATLTKRRDEDWFMSADDCMKYGVCDQIVTSMDEIL